MSNPYLTTPALVATGNVSPSRFVAQDTTVNFGGRQAVAGDAPIGISQPGIAQCPDGNANGYAGFVGGPQFTFYGAGCTAPLQAGPGGWVPGFLKPDANGCGVPASPADGVAIAFDTAGANEVRKVYMLNPERLGNLFSYGANATLTNAQAYQKIFVTAADVVFTLPGVAASVGQTFEFIANASNAALQAGTLGWQVALPSADVTANVQVRGSGLTAANGKGVVNSKATATQGDSISLYSDGSNWWVTGKQGTWVIHA